MTTTYTSYDQLPLALCADDVAAVLGISRANAYTLMHSKDFPTITIGKRMIVPKDKFIKWIDDNTEEYRELKTPEELPFDMHDELPL